MSFADVTRLELLGPNRFRARFDESWAQGRALFGGIQAAALVRAFRETGVDPERSLKTLTVHFCQAAEPGAVEIEAAIEREGGYVSQMSGRLRQGGATVAAGLATFARPRRDETLLCEGEPPRLPPPETLPSALAHPPFPAFLQHVDLRLTPMSIPFSGAQHPQIEGWCRFLDPGPADDVLLAGLLDIWPPAVLPVFSSPRPSASVDLRYDVLGAWPPPGATAGEHYPFRVRALHMAEGYLVDEGELWTPSGRPMARIRQLRVVF